jgi:hypothetical protein
MLVAEISKRSQALGINIKNLLHMAGIDSSTFYKWHRGELSTLQGHVGKLLKCKDYLDKVEEAQKIFKK